MTMSYTEWQPSPPLTGVVTAFWVVAGDGGEVTAPAILPDGHVEIVFNLGDPVRLDGPAFTGWQPERAAVGPLSYAVRMTYGARVRTLGIRFHPARGAAFLGVTATMLAEKILPIAQVAPHLDEALAATVRDEPNPKMILSSEHTRKAIDAVLRAQLFGMAPPDDEIAAVVDRLLLPGESDTLTVANIAKELGITPRHVQRRFLAAVGITPKRFIRVVRFARAWQAASMSEADAWADLALEHGFADQAHLVREFRAFGAEPPTQQFSPEWYAATTLTRVAGPAPGVRSVQEGPRRLKR
jgi:AraC-like DNA-binding protein